MRRWRQDLRTLVVQGREDGDITVDTDDDVVVEQLLAIALGLQVLALLPDAPTDAVDGSAVEG